MVEQRMLYGLAMKVHGDVEAFLKDGWRVVPATVALTSTSTAGGGSVFMTVTLERFPVGGVSLLEELSANAEGGR